MVARGTFQRIRDRILNTPDTVSLERARLIPAAHRDVSGGARLAGLSARFIDRSLPERPEFIHRAETMT